MEKEDFHFKPFCLATLGVLSCSEKWKSRLYWTLFHSLLLLFMKTLSFIFCTNIYVCAQGIGRFPITKRNTVPASRQTLQIPAISIFQQSTPWLRIYLSVALRVFLCQLQQGEPCCSSATSCHCFDWKSRGCSRAETLAHLHHWHKQ